ncbi:Carbohydrate sulfotransferase 14 [Mizuhopecten yessoensis]|uniref:Carbohydrate sulfotransferase n=1 Tax=Mizuhopecten yessoensis TaxID=6573 RepID=A0A210Q244_MIZYE|nr:Carbohydrate sulfotransferase 14 [Mizuhopecten yessoensis]
MFWKMMDVLPVRMVRRQLDKNVFLFGILVVLTLYILYVNRTTSVRIPIPEGLSDADSKRDSSGKALLKDFVSTRKERRSIMRQACHNSTQSKNKLDIKNLDHIIVSDKYQALFCFVPKVACSQWKKVFLLMSGHVDDPKKLDEYSVHFNYSHLLRYLDQYKKDEIEHRIQTYKKIIMVRDPLDRLLSAFKNKFHGTGFKDPTYSNIAKFIVRNYRKDFKQPVLGDDVTFLEFIRYVTDDGIGAENEHWRTVMKLCAPCQIEYDFVGKYETLQDDADFIMSQIAPHIDFPAKPKAYGSSNTSQHLPHYLSQLPLNYVGAILCVFLTYIARDTVA